MSRQTNDGLLEFYLIKAVAYAACLLLLVLAPCQPTSAQVPVAQMSATRDMPDETTNENPTVLQQAHAHNDYLHARPLLDALDCGFNSVEADVFLVDETLLVAHTQFELSKNKTLEKLYFQPLQQRIKANQGSVHKDGKTFTLLIDFKSDGAATYLALKKLLQRYPELTDQIDPQTNKIGPVQIIISGDRPVQEITADTQRKVAIDGRLSDLDSSVPASIMPLISDRWSSHFKWRGRGEVPAEDIEKLKSIVSKAHAAGRRVRFWGIPDKANAWQLLHQHKVDLINTDRLSDLRDFLLEHSDTQRGQAEPASNQ